MGVATTLREIMKYKKLSTSDLAEMTGRSSQTIYNTFSKDNIANGNGMSFKIVEEYANAMGCEILFRDKDTGRIF